MSESPEFMTWDDIMETCSRLHTTRKKPLYSRPELDDGELREASEMIDVTVDGRPAQIVPTRMHEPGFYWRWMDQKDSDGYAVTMRNPDGDALLRAYANQGLVQRV